MLATLPPHPPPWLETVSASQVESFRKCPRTWFNARVLGLESPPSASQVAGTSYHTDVEKYLRTGKIPDTKNARLVEVAAEHLPAPVSLLNGASGVPGDGLLIEHEIIMPTYRGGPFWHGFVDLVDVRGPVLRIFDHKTTSDFRWNKTERELRRDTQMISYARWALFHKLTVPDALVVSDTEAVFDMQRASAGEKPSWVTRIDTIGIELYLVYVRTKGAPVACPVAVRLTADEVAAEWGNLLTVVQDMEHYAAGAGAGRLTKGEHLPAHTEHCGAYGGCIYRPLCGLEPRGERRFTMPAPGKPTLLERLKAKHAEQSKKGSKTAAPPTAEEDEETEDEEQDAPVPTKGEHAAAPAAPAKGAKGIIPPDAPSRTSKPAQTAAVVEEDDEDDEPEAAAPKTPKVKSAAPTKTAAPKTPPVVQADEHDEGDDDADQDVPPPPPAKAKRPNGTVDLTIYVDSFPVKGDDRGEVTMFEDWFAPFAEKVAADNEVDDWRMMKWGEGKGALAALIRERIKISGLPRVLHVSSFQAGSDVALEVLVPMAKSVVRATRG
jgi:hypothetical protein